MWFIGMVAVFMFVIGIITAGTDIVLNTVKVNGYYGDSLTDTAVLKAGLNIARESLIDDANWGDCKNADQNCSETDSYGFFPLYSPSLQKTIEDFPIGQKGKLTIKVKFPDSQTALVIVKAQTPKLTRYYGVKFQRSAGGLPQIPLAYAPQSTVSGGVACSWFWDGKRLKGVTNPNFIVYLDNDFYWSPDIYVPDYANGDNPKDVIFATNFSTEVSGYKEIDKVYTTGDLYLKNGAHLGVAYADGNVYIDDSSSADEVVENGNFVFPSFRKSLPLNQVNAPNYVGGDTFYCLFGKKTITGVHFYDTFYATGCDLTFENARIYVNTLISYKSTIKIVNSTINSSGYLESINSILKVDGENNQIKTYGTYAYNSEIYWNAENSSFEAVKGFFRKNTIYPSTLFNPKFENLYFWKNTFNDCTNPQYCLWDTNNLIMEEYSRAVGTFLVRKQATLDYSSGIIGNVFAIKLTANSPTLCNIVDSTGNQIVADEEDFYHLIVEKSGGLNSSVSIIYQTVCKGEEDCINQLE